jgi:NarL family two-component system response regulator LiaR
MSNKSRKIIRVLIADDHAIIRKGVKAVLDLIPDMELVAEAANGVEAIALEQELHPDVILMDLLMPEMNGIEAIKRIMEQNPKAHILVLTNFAGEEMLFPAIKAGALGYHLKDSAPEELVEALRQVNAGEAALHPVIARKLLNELVQPAEHMTTRDALTQREVEVLQLIAQGFENKDIAKQLFISEATARTHVSNILSKLHLASRTQAALYALKEGIASIDQIPDNS